MRLLYTVFVTALFLSSEMTVAANSLVFYNTCDAVGLNYSSKKAIVSTVFFFLFHIISSIKLF